MNIVTKTLTAFVLIISVNLSYSQKTISFGGQYSAIHKADKRFESNNNGASARGYSELYNPNIEAPGLVLSIDDSTRWKRIISIVALEFDSYSIVTEHPLGQTGQSEYSGDKVSRIYTHLEYGWRYRVFGPPASWFKAYAGFSIEPIIERIEVVPYRSNEFDWNELNASLAISGSMLAEAQLSKRLRLGLSGHIWLGEVYYEQSYVDNPILMHGQRVNRSLGADLILPRVRGTLSILYSLTYDQS